MWLSAVATVLFPAAAHADGVPWGSVGLHLGYTFGERGGFSWGLHGTGGYVWFGSTMYERTGAGGLLELNFVKLEPHLTLGLQAGGGLDLVDFGGEVGFTWRAPEEFSLHLGAYTGLAYGPFLSGSYAPGFHQGTVKIGAGVPRYFPIVGEEGRPLRLEATEAPPNSTSAPHGSLDSEPAAASLHWSASAQAECDAVTAFLQLFAELDALDAPTSLLHACLRAAEQEIEHARSAATIAADLNPEHASWPEFRQVTPRASLLELHGATAWARLAGESIHDGMVTEGTAALAARAMADTARSSATRVHQRKVAVEEAGHAHLGRAIVEQALGFGGEEVRATVEAARTDTLAGATPQGASAVEGLEAWGRPSAGSWLAAHERASVATARSLASLLERSRPLHGT